MRFLGSTSGMTNVLSTTERFVVMSEEDFNQILVGLNILSLLCDQVENPTDIDGNPLEKARVSDVTRYAHYALGNARYMQLVIS